MDKIKRAILGFILINSVHSLAHPIPHYWQNRTQSAGGLYLNPKWTSFSTTENYDLNSSTYTIPGLTNLNHSFFDLNVTYGFSEDVFLFSRISATRASLTTALNGQQTGFGFSDQLLGGAYRIYKTENGSNFSVQLDVSIPTYSNTDSFANAEPWLGDQSTDITAGTFAEFPIPGLNTLEWYIEAGAAFLWRSKGYSSAFPWSVQLKREPQNEGIFFSAGLQGQQSMQTDTLLPAAAMNDSNRGAAGSVLINAVNPTWMQARGSLGYQFSNLRLQAEAGSTFLGTYAPKGTWLSFGITARLGWDEKGETESTSQPLRKIVRNEQQFTAYSLESKVTSVNDKLYLVKIDKGADDGVEVGQRFDIFGTDPNDDSRQIRIARAKVTHVRDHESALNVVEYFQELLIDRGAAARRLP